LHKICHKCPITNEKLQDKIKKALEKVLAGSLAQNGGLGSRISELEKRLGLDNNNSKTPLSALLLL